VISTVSLDAPATTHTAGLESFIVTLTVTNPSFNTYSLLIYNTPFEGIQDNIFDVQRSSDSLPARYIGIKSKRVKPTTPTAYKTLLPRTTSTASVDITSSYFFEADGEYQISFKKTVMVLPELDMNDTSKLAHRVTLGQSNTIIVHVNGTATQKPHQYLKAISGQNCSGNQDSQVDSATKIAIQMAQQGLDYLTSDQCDDSYVTWFGTRTELRWGKIKNNTKSITDLLQSGNFLHYCNPQGCSPNTYAYVYPRDPTHTIYLCGAFWSAPDGIHQEDSKPGTLVHEASHFVDIAATDDIVYGSNGCRRLAKTNPNQAIINADSHEYFVEFDPKC
jgi:peptidyl-Lys metalloendopeptidase